MTDGKLPVVYPMVRERALGAAKRMGADAPARPTQPDPTRKHYVPEILCTGLGIAGAYLLFM